MITITMTNEQAFELQSQLDTFFKHKEQDVTGLRPRTLAGYLRAARVLDGPWDFSTYNRPPTYTYPEDCYWPTPIGEWIDWHGGECPIPEGVEFELRYRGDRDARPGIGREGLRWDHREPSYQTWGGDIMAYRLLP